MKDTVDSKKVVGSFVSKYISFAVIIGGISFILENVIPQLVHWNFRTEHASTLVIYQSVLFVISTLLTIILAVQTSIKKVKISNEEEAKEIAKPIKTILIIVALILMVISLVYCYQIEQSYYKDIENDYPVVEGVQDESRDISIKYEKKSVQSVANIYMATKEIIIILTYAYAVIYVEKMIFASIAKKTSKKANKKVVQENE